MNGLDIEYLRQVEFRCPIELQIVGVYGQPRLILCATGLDGEKVRLADVPVDVEDGRLIDKAISKFLREVPLG